MAALVGAANGGSEQAWNLLLARFGDLVWAVARSHGLSECDASDVVQTVWLRLYQQLGRLSAPERVGAWLVTTARRECLRLLREQSRQVPSAAVEQLASELGPAADELDLPEEMGLDSREFWQAYARLPAECQVILRMLVAEPGMSYQSVSEALGLPLGSIGPRRARCLDRLRASLLYRLPSGRENGAAPPAAAAPPAGESAGPGEAEEVS